MEAAVVNRFLRATSEVLTEYFSIAVTDGGAPTAVKGVEALDTVSVILGVTGDLEGHFLLGCPQETALGIARTMLGNPDYPELDEMCISALAELGNMIGGMTSTSLADMGYLCSLSPPSVVTTDGGPADIHLPMMICLPISTTAGGFRVCIGLRAAGGA